MCNLKSNKSMQEILVYKRKIEKIKKDNIEFVLFPSNIYIPFFYDAKYKIGSQNVSKYNDGSHTGEILASQLKSLHVSYVLINHCETEETLLSIVDKIKNATKSHIKVVLCVGKNIKNTTNIQNEIEAQVKEIINQLTKEEIENCMIAFEPCFLINQDDILSPAEIEKIAKEIKNIVSYQSNVIIKVLYGGSINTENIQKLLKIDNLDGYLIGNCANNPDNILKIANLF